MSSMANFWTAAIVIFLLKRNFGVCENLHQDTKDPRRGLSMACTNGDPNNASISCHGMRIVRRVIQQLLDSARTNIEIADGMRLVNSEDAGSAARRARNLKEMGKMGPIVGFFYGKELRVKLPSLMPENLETAIRDSLPTGRGKGGDGLGGGGKKGDNSLLIMAVMMGKMMAAIGFGSLGMLAMKALMVSSLALMLSLIIAAKKFTSSQDSDGGHHIVYAQDTGHHHSKRSVDFQNPEFSPYGGYTSVYGISRFS